MLARNTMSKHSSSKTVGTSIARPKYHDQALLARNTMSKHCSSEFRTKVYHQLLTSAMVSLVEFAAAIERKVG